MTKFPLRLAPGLLAALMLFVAGCGTERATTNDIVSWTSERKEQNVESEKYIILKGDRVEISVAGYPEFNVTVPVKEDGTLTIPLVGEIPAAGKTQSELTEQIVSRLSSYVKNKVEPSIRIKGALDQKLIVLGSVTTQGTYPATAPISPFQALALAGGPTPTADLRHVRVFRGGVVDATVVLDLSATLAALPGRADATPLVYPGDLIYVPREENVIRDFADLLRDVIVLFGIFAIVR